MHVRKGAICESHEIPELADLTPSTTLTLALESCLLSTAANLPPFLLPCSPSTGSGAFTLQFIGLPSPVRPNPFRFFHAWLFLAPSYMVGKHAVPTFRHALSSQMATRATVRWSSPSSILTSNGVIIARGNCLILSAFYASLASHHCGMILPQAMP